MDSTHPNQFNSPKRKRGPPAISRIPPTPPTSSPPPAMRLNTSIPGVVITEDEERTGSPRTKVAYNFQGLQLEDGGDVGRFELDESRVNKLQPRNELEDDPMRQEEAVRKRVKILKEHKGREIEIPETPDVRAKGGEKQFSIFIGPERTIDPFIGQTAKGVVLSNGIDPVIFKGSAVTRMKEGSSLGKAYPSINRLSDSKSRGPKKRAGTPPMTLFGGAEASLETEGRTIVDPDRAALTWHDDEITGHDPTDPDDDGEGINGIGFKPTPAEAYARAQKRRQQMTEYRNREAREARKIRSERRRGSEMSKASKEEQETARRVRFLEAEVKSIITT